MKLSDIGQHWQKYREKRPNLSCIDCKYTLKECKIYRIEYPHELWSTKYWCRRSIEWLTQLKEEK